ncbi:MAG: TVP38/TMEM64 family protein [Clostridia bacterium]|nr:MAG: TVP38/TMEM64 family protein [Clostridia bacterium]
MVLQALVLPLPAFIITFTNAWLYGWAWGAALSWSGAMLAALLCYGLARWFGRPLVESLVGGRNLAAADAFFTRYGAQAVLITRLIPVISFDLVSYAAGLTSVGLWTFFWATGLGQLPATLVYSYVGQSLGQGAQVFLWGLSLAFVFVTAGWGLRSWLQSRRVSVDPAPGEEGRG